MLCMQKQRVICLDLEGTLAEELWLLISEKTGIEELKITTRDIPDTKLLAKTRIETVNKHGLTLTDLKLIATSAKAFEGARDFLTRLQKIVPRIIITTDLAEELAGSYLEQLGFPTFFGQQYIVEDDKLIEFVFRQDNHKYELVKSLRAIGFEVYAAGDSYNDIPMFEIADKGVLFRAPEKIKQEYPDIPKTASYDELLNMLTSGLQ